MSDAARAKAHLVVTLLERADDPDIAAGVIAEALDAFAAEQTAQVRQEVESVLLADEQTIERLTALVERLREELMGHEHACAACRVLLADPAVQGIEVSSREKA